jgi:hypothetical protein
VNQITAIVYKWEPCQCHECHGEGILPLPPPPVSHRPTPWAVFCPQHGRVYLTNHEYNRQMNHANWRWECPICLRVSEWDDETYEAAEEQLYQEQEVEQ